MNKKYAMYLVMLLGVSQRAITKDNSIVSFDVKNETKKPIYVLVDKDAQYHMSMNPYKIAPEQIKKLGYKKLGPKKGQFAIKWSYDGQNWYASDVNNSCCLAFYIRANGEYGKKIKCIKKLNSMKKMGNVNLPKSREVWGFRADGYYQKIPQIVLKDKALFVSVTTLLKKIVDGATSYAQQRAKGRKIDEVKPPYIDSAKIKCVEKCLEKKLKKKLKIEVKKRYV